jgi:hypothetical protein
MKTPKHTQGPWKQVDETIIPWGNETAKVATIEGADDQVVALSILYGPFIDDINNEAEAEANAALIAAAPEMLEALESALETMIFYCEQREEDDATDICCNQIRAAIRKARGES